MEYVKNKVLNFHMPYVRNSHKQTVYDKYPKRNVKLPPFLFEIAIGNRLGDRIYYKNSWF